INCQSLNENTRLTANFQTLLEWEKVYKVSKDFAPEIDLGRPGVKLVTKKSKKPTVEKLKPKLISVDERPNPTKRPRLDFDPNGLDLFGLDSLLGLNNQVLREGQEKEQGTIAEMADVEMGQGNSIQNEEAKRIDLNSQPESSESSKNPGNEITDDAPDVSHEKTIHNEVEETVSLAVLDGHVFDGDPDVVIASKFARLRTVLKYWWAALKAKEWDELLEMQSEIDRWRANFVSAEEFQEFELLVTKLQGLSIGVNSDRWTWAHNSDATKRKVVASADDGGRFKVIHVGVGGDGYYDGLARWWWMWLTQTGVLEREVLAVSTDRWCLLARHTCRRTSTKDDELETED
ncbi:hypothetical protein M8C21_013509, partial [Ambrosia artemisiifolia]